MFFHDDEPLNLDRYEVYVDAKDIQQEMQNNGETVQISDEEYIELLQEKGAENLVPITESSESTIAVNDRQYQYNKDYFVGDYVTVQHAIALTRCAKDVTNVRERFFTQAVIIVRYMTVL